MKKKAVYFLSVIILVGLFGFGFREAHFSVSAVDNETNDETLIVDDEKGDTSKDDNIYSDLAEAIIAAEDDYETVTTIELIKNETLTGESINVKSGQNIIIKSQAKEVTIGQEFLGYTVTLSNTTIALDRQATLTLEANFVLTNASSIYASPQSSGSNDFYAKLYVNDSLTLDGGSINSRYFKTFEINGALNVSSGSNTIISNSGITSSDESSSQIPTSPIKLGLEAAVILLVGSNNSTGTTITGQIHGSVSNSTNKNEIYSGKTNKSVFVTNAGTGYNDKFDENVKLLYGYNLVSSNSMTESNGNYILTANTKINGNISPQWWPPYTRVSDFTIESSETLNIFSYGDINVTVSGGIYVEGTLSLGGSIDSDGTIYTNGTNNIVFDGGTTWKEDSDGSYYFVTDAYEPGVGNAENFGRTRYSGTGDTSSAIISGKENSTINLFKGSILQNRINNTTSDSGDDDIGGGVALYGSSTTNKPTLNMYGATIQYNALPNVHNSAGGAGIGAQNAVINMYDGYVIYNTVYGPNYHSTDGAGVSLITSSFLNMFSGLIGYNHGGIGGGTNGSDSDADGGGVMVRNSSELNIKGGDIAYNFTYGFGGGICVWNSKVTIEGGSVYGNRASYGGGIATSSNDSASLTLNAGANGSRTKIYSNTAFKNTNTTKDTGYGGGIAIGNGTHTSYTDGQTLYLHDAEITNNTADFGGGISNYSRGGSYLSRENNKIYLYGGYIAENKASQNEQGNGIYCINFNNSGTNQMIYLSGNVQVDTSNNIILANIASNQVPIEVTGSLSATGIVGLIGIVDSSENYVYDDFTGKNIIHYTSGNPQTDKFLLDTSEYEFVVNEDEDYIQVARTTSNQTTNFVTVTSDNTGKGSFSTLSAALAAGTGTNITLTINKSKTLTADDIITIPSGKNVTIISAGSNPFTLSLGETFAFGETLFTVNSGGTLTLSNIVIDGNKERTVSSNKDGGNLIVQNNGTFTLETNAIIQNNRGVSNLASVIEIGRGNTITNINGKIQNNESYYGAVYSVYSTTVINVGSSAIIKNTTYLGSDYNLAGNDLDVLLEGGTFNLNSFAGEIGVIGKIGSCKINAIGTFTNQTPINVFVGDQQYYRNNTIVYSMQPKSDTDQTLVAGSINYTSHFRLLLPHVQYDTLKKSNTNYDTVLSMVLAIEISIQDIWQINSENEYEKLNSEGISVSDANFDTEAEIDNLATALGIGEYTPDYRANTKTIIFYIDTIKQLNLSGLRTLAIRDGYSVSGFVLHASDAEVGESVDNTKYYGLTSTISTKDYSDQESHIYLGVVYQPDTYAITFDNGGLETVKGAMDVQQISYEAFTSTGSSNLDSTLNSLGYYATGFVFLGWKVKTSDGYVQDDNNQDLILADGADLATNSYITTISNAVGSTNFTFVAQWASIFTGETYNGSSSIGVGTSNNPFIINSNAGLSMLALTINGKTTDEAKTDFSINLNVDGSSKEYKYYNVLVNEDTTSYLAFKPMDYSGYYFKLSDNFDNSNNAFTEVIATVDKISENVFGDSEHNLSMQSADILRNAIPFSGNFDGSNKTVYLNITGDNDFVGLFGYTKNANISNITIAGSVSGRISVGGLVGLSEGGIYSNIRNKANISFTGVNAGGIFGTYYLTSADYRNGSITNVVNEGDVSYSNATNSTTIDKNPEWEENSNLKSYYGSRAGGIIGQGWHITLSEAYNIGNITAKLGVGGLVGTMISENDNTKTDNTISTGFNAGTITATAGLASTYKYGTGDSEIICIQINAYVGGIVGRLNGSSTISNSMNIGDVTASWVGEYEGTFQYDNMDAVSFSYNTSTNGTRIGARGAGGIVGETSIELGTLLGGNKDLRSVINTGTIEAWSYVGGIAGIFAYSDLSYAMNVGIVKANGYLTFGGQNYAFNGALVGLGVAANLLATSVFDGDIKYEGQTDSTIQAIGDNEANTLIGYAANNNQAKKLASSHLICQTSNQKPYGLDSTFFDSGWDWQSYDEDNYYYYPQLASFVNSNITLQRTNDVNTGTTEDGSSSTDQTETVTSTAKTVSQLSQEAVRLASLEGPVSDQYKVDLVLELDDIITVPSDFAGISIQVTADSKIDFVYDATDKTLSATINYISYRDLVIDLSAIISKIGHDGYDFGGWYRDAQYSEEFKGNVYLEDNTIYAKWTPTVYNINYTNINAYSAGEISLPNEYKNTFTIDDSGRINLLTAADLGGNGAYDFVSWQYVVGGTNLNVDSFEISGTSGTYQLVLYYNNSQVSVIPLSNLEIRLECSAHKYDIIYDLGAINTGEVTTNNNRSQFTIEDDFDFVDPTKSGYRFEGWYTTSDFDDDTKITGISRGTYLRNAQEYHIYAKFVEDTYNLYIDLNDGTLKANQITFNDETYAINTDQTTGTRYIQIAYKSSLNGFVEALKGIITAPSGRTFSSVSVDESGSNAVTNDTTMTAGAMQVYVIYTTTTYTITIDAGSIVNSNETGTSTNITFNNINISNYSGNNLTYYEISSIVLENGQIKVTTSYGSDLSKLLNALVAELESKESNTLSVNKFNGYSSTPSSLNIYNVRVDGTTTLSITFQWTQSEYHLEILNKNYEVILIITNTENYGTVSSNNTLDLAALIAKVKADNKTKIVGYTFDDAFTRLDGQPVSNGDVLTGYNTFVAQYTANTYDVVFYQNYSATDSTSYTDLTGYELTYDALIPSGILSITNKTRPGYTFLGWSLTSDGVILNANSIYNPSTITTTQDDEVVLYAIWQVKTYNINYEIVFDKEYVNTPRLDLSVLPSSYTYNSEVGGLVISRTLSLTGYDFDGYSLSQTGGTPQLTITNEGFATKDSDSVLVYVIFTIKKYTVTFDAGSGSFGSNPSQNVTLVYNDIPNNFLPTEPTRTGYVFAGYDNTTNLTKYVQDIPLDDNNQIKFTAQWTKKSYTVTFYAEGTGTWSSQYLYEATITGLDITNLETKNPGKVITGWQCDDKQLNRDFTYTDEGKVVPFTITEDTTLVAIWGNAEYELTINVNYAGTGNINELVSAIQTQLSRFETSISNNSIKITVEYNTDLATLIESISRNMTSSTAKTYYFVSLDKVVGVMPSSNLTITATYSDSDEATNVINLNIKIVKMDNNNIHTTTNVTYSLAKSDTYNITMPSYQGYDFAKWYSDNTLASEITDLNVYINNQTEKEITIYAKYTIKSFTLIYSTNLDGTNELSAIGYYNQAIKNVLPQPTNLDGYTFGGWYIGTKNVNDTIIVADMNGIYAKWVAVDYQIRFVYDNATLSTGNIKIGDQIPLPTIGAANSDFVFAVNNYQYYDAKYYIWATKGDESKKLYFSDIFTNGVMLNLSNLNLDGGYSVTVDTDAASGVTYITLTLELAAKKFEIRFEDETLATVTIDITNDSNSLPKPTDIENYYKFVGYTNQSNNNKYLEDKSSYTFNELISLFSYIDLINGYIVLTTNEEPITYTINETISFNVKDDNYVDISGLTYGVYPGKTFKGWTVGDKHYNDSIPVAKLYDLMDKATDGKITLDPYYEPNSYLINFNSNGGSFVESMVVKYNDMVSAPTAPTKTGYEFAGWYLDNGTFENPYNFSSVYSSSKNTILYAKWTANKYTIKFHNGDETHSQEFEYGQFEALDYNTFEKVGYTFKGWATSNDSNVVKYTDGEVVSNLSSEKDYIIDLFAVFGLEIYDITYNLNGGQNGANPDGYSVETLVEFKNPTRLGYIFGGWYLDSEYITPIRDTTGYAKDLVLYAKWDIINYSISFNLNGGSYNNSTQTIIISVEYGANINTILAGKIDELNLSKLGYTFDSWLLNGQELTDQDLVIGDIELVAKWNASKYGITYVLNDGTNNSANLDEYTIENGVIVLYEPTRTGYTFDGWYLDSNFTGNKIESFVATELIEKTFYAKWAANEYQINLYVAGGDELISSSIKVTYGQSIASINLPTPTKFGYNFEGWYLGNTLFNSETYTYSSNIDLVARWTLIQYDISYNLDGGQNNNANPQKYTVESVVTFVNPTKAGYTFVGWYIGDKLVTSTNGYAENLELVAKWSEALTYTSS